MAVSGDLAPEDAGVFDRFSDAILKDDGQVVFRGCLSGGNPCSQNSVFRVDGASIIEIARENSQVPGSSDTFSEIDSFTLNDVGQIILDVHVTGVGGVRKGAIYRTDGTSFVQIVRAGHLRRSDCEQEDTRRGGGTLDAED
ncbi:MAG: choice-of-anchor tandem repeat NxxGxxAF-containing protein [Pirellulales bacterium]